MKVCFWYSDKPRERILADAFGDGVRAHGDTFEQRSLVPEPIVADCDVACMVGVKSRERYRAHVEAGVHVVYLDKGYTRHAAPGDVKLWEYWRVSLDSHHPTEWIARESMPDDRVDRLDLVMQPWRAHNRSRAILLAGSSEKYHEFYNLKHPTDWANKRVRQIREVSARPIIYRPKPSWRNAVEIPGTRFSGRDLLIDLELAQSHVLVTHGSNAVFEAVLLGVPCIVLGDAVAKPISATEITAETIENPPLATYNTRWQWLANLAYWQWTMPEMHRGECWAHLRPRIYGP